MTLHNVVELFSCFWCSTSLTTILLSAKKPWIGYRGSELFATSLRTLTFALQQEWLNRAATPRYLHNIRVPYKGKRANMLELSSHTNTTLMLGAITDVILHNMLNQLAWTMKRKLFSWPQPVEANQALGNPSITNNDTVLYSTCLHQPPCCFPGSFCPYRH